MEDIETVEIEVNELTDNAYKDKSLIAPQTAKIISDAYTSDNETFTEEMKYDNAMMSESEKNSSSVLPLSITIVICFIIGIVLGIMSAKRAANK